jgi:Zn-dependent peptidase ImmA (M78 family)
LVAHELGHYVLQQASVPQPLGEKEYWQHENLCNEFARRLLVPESCVCGFQNAFENVPEAKLNLALHIERRAKVPWAVAAYRVAEANPNFAFLGLVSKEGRLKVSISTLPQKKEIGRLIDSESDLRRALGAISKYRIAETLNVRYLTGLPTLAKAAISAAVVKTSPSEFRIAAQMI